jgi:hypothetical protein
VVRVVDEGCSILASGGEAGSPREYGVRDAACPISTG